MCRSPSGTARHFPRLFDMPSDGPKLRLSDLFPDFSEAPALQRKDDPFAGSYLGDGVFLTKLWSRHLVKLLARDTIVAPHIIELGYIEPHISRLLVSLTQPGDVFVDVGANIGYYSVLGGWRAWPGGEIWAFEPHPRLFPLLSDNLVINGYAAIAHRHRVALSDKTGAAPLRTFEGYEATSTIRTLSPAFVQEADRQTGKTSRMLEVELARLDDVMRDVPEIHVLKIDAEGHEPAIVRGAQEILARSRQLKIVMEFVPPIMARDEALAHLQLLRDLGFSIFRLDSDGHLTPQRDDNALIQIEFSDLFLTRR